jgi:hypothetical protein
MGGRKGCMNYGGYVNTGYATWLVNRNIDLTDGICTYLPEVSPIPMGVGEWNGYLGQQSVNER